MSFDVLDGEWWILYLTKDNVKMFQSRELLGQYLLGPPDNLTENEQAYRLAVHISEEVRIIRFRTLSTTEFEVAEQGDDFWREITIKMLARRKQKNEQT